MKKTVIGIVVLTVVLLGINSYGEQVDDAFQDKVWGAIESLKDREPVKRDEFVDIDTQKVHFPHKRHQELLNELNETCAVCHHERGPKGEGVRACKGCHGKRSVISQGKYARKGQVLKLKDVFHFLCGDCHQKMLENGYQRRDSSPGQIPSKCHHCHVRKEK